MLDKIKMAFKTFFVKDQVNSTDDQSLQKKKRKKKLIFVLSFMINREESKMFKHMEVIGIDYIEFFRQNRYQIKVSNQGLVQFCFIENFPMSHHTDKDSATIENDLKNKSVIQARFNCTTISKKKDLTFIGDDRFNVNHQFFCSMIEFSKDAML